MAEFCCYAMEGIPADCGTNIGGIVRAWGACHSDAAYPTLTDDMVSAVKNPEKWHLYEFQEQTGSLTFTMSDNTAASSKLWSNAIVFQFAKMEQAKRLEMMGLTQSVTDWIVEDNNGNYWYIGYDFGAKVSEGTGETGTAYEDFNGYNVTLTAVEKQHPYLVTDAAMQPLLDEEEDNA